MRPHSASYLMVVNRHVHYFDVSGWGPRHKINTGLSIETLLDISRKHFGMRFITKIDHGGVRSLSLFNCLFIREQLPRGLDQWSFSQLT